MSELDSAHMADIRDRDGARGFDLQSAPEAWSDVRDLLGHVDATDKLVERLAVHMQCDPSLAAIVQHVEECAAQREPFERAERELSGPFHVASISSGLYTCAGGFTHRVGTTCAGHRP